jgi:type II restriction/modification system DNA methylase subunit YeeA
MNPAEFAAKWMGNTNTERAAAQEHFLDLCHMVGAPTPNSDRSGENYAFERGASKTSGGEGWADVWLRGHFGWEYKGHHRDLERAYKQLLDYREALENPPLLVVCDLDRFIVRTNFTNTVRKDYTFTLTDLRDRPAEPLRILRALFENPDELRPTKTRAELTEEAASTFASLAVDLQSLAYDPQAIAHFLNKLLFVLFAEDSNLLPPGLIGDLAKNLRAQPASFQTQLGELFRLMSTEPGGSFGPLPIQWFNGGLFDGAETFPLSTRQIDLLAAVARLDWSQIEPAIFGTLFERGLDPSKRGQLGAHYTDRRSIERVVEPVLIQPLEREFEVVKAEVLAIIEGVDLRAALRGTELAARTRTVAKAKDAVTAFLTRLEALRVLDPACGSGNFLYVALQALKDLERRVLVWEATTLGAAMRFPQLGPQNVQGIELNPYAAELARVCIWIGEIQWMISNGFAYQRDPVLRPLRTIQCRDAVLDLSTPGSPVEPVWPDAYAIIGNPPFIGGKLMRTNLSDSYVDALFATYNGQVARESDFVIYWFEKARAMIDAGRAQRAGLLATQGIRGGANRKVLERIKETGDIFLAWSDEEWVVEGAAVHVSIVGFDDGTQAECTLDEQPVPAINANLTAGLDLTQAKRLRANLNIAFMGDTKGGPFDIPASVAARLLAGANPDGRSNADVVRPWVNALDIAGRPRDMWIVDFGEMPITEAALYEDPFTYAEAHIKPERLKARSTTGKWWLHERPRADMRTALERHSRYLITPRVSKYRIFAWLDVRTLPDSATIAFARDDDYFFGVVHSRVHELWARGMGTQLREVESGFRYTPTTTFETFPLPNPTPAQESAIAAAAKALDTLRQGWLNPSGVAVDLSERTLTNLYNQRPAWLRQAHERLDAAVLAAYGWPVGISDEDLLTGLLALNHTRAASQPS